jgi:Protein of unknown function (DUF2997)
MPMIEITIAADGRITLDAVDYQGPSCEEATAAIEAALGTVEQRSRKPEYYHPQPHRQQERIR